MLRSQPRLGQLFLEKTSLTKPYAMLNKELVKDLPVVGKAGAVRIPDYERILSLKPDVLFILSVESSEPDLVQRKLRIPVVAVSQGLPNFDEEEFLCGQLSVDLDLKALKI